MQPTSNTKPFATQREKLRALFDRREGEWIPLPDIQALGIAQHGARIVELRREYARLGFQIENKMEQGHDGIKRSWYRKVRQAHPWRTPFSEKRMAEDWQEPKHGPTRHDKAEWFERVFGKSEPHTPTVEKELRLFQ